MKREDAEAHLRAAGVPEPAAFFQDLEWTIWSGNTILGRGATLRLALDAAGHPDQTAAKFTHFGSEVVQGTQTAARARSPVMARRIANALNSYKAGPKGY